MVYRKADMEKLPFHQKVYEGYQEVLRRYPQRIVKIDAAKEPEEVVADALAAIKKGLETYTA